MSIFSVNSSRTRNNVSSSESTSILVVRRSTHFCEASQSYLSIILFTLLLLYGVFELNTQTVNIGLGVEGFVRNLYFSHHHSLDRLSSNKQSSIDSFVFDTDTFGRNCKGMMAAAGDDTQNGLLVSKNLATIHLILASQSPRRAEILDMMGLRGQYIAIPSPLDESELQQKFESEEPHEYARILANGKARALGEALLNKDDTIVNTVVELQKNRGIDTYRHTKTLVIGSDTIVDCNGQILEKPTNKNDAVQMLTKLSGRWHKVHTGVLVYSSLNSYKDPVISFTETTDVLFGSFSKKDVGSNKHRQMVLDEFDVSFIELFLLL